MDIEQVGKMYDAIKENAVKWAKNEECSPLYQLDVVVIGEYLNMDIPAYFHHFEASENPNHVSATGAYRSILKTLDKMQKCILVKLC